MNILEKKDYGFSKELDQKTYNLYIGGFLLYGFVINWFLTAFCYDWIVQIPVIPFLIGYFVCAIGGTCLMRFTNNVFLSFIGYNLLVLPVGCCVAMLVPSYSAQTVYLAFGITAVCTTGMMVAGTVYPDFFLKLGRVLFFSLALCIITEVILLLFGVNLGIYDWIVSIVFCGYIGYDWARINTYSCYTVDSAIDSAGSLYLDIINLFIRILSILGRRSNNN